jgi:hypothetical protein
MDDICEYIVANKNATNCTRFSTLQYMTEDYTRNIIDGIIIDLKRLLGKNEIKNVERFDDNLGLQRHTIVTFEFENVKCNISEHFDTQRDYWCVAIVPI